MKICRACSKNFVVYPEDLVFYKKIKVPEPTLCPNCRQQRRAAFRNERSLYRRKCDFSGKNIISIYSQDKKFKVYDQEIWWSDKWDGREYGRDFDFERPFFEQFGELMAVVPRTSLFSLSCENSPYCNHSVYNKNCYMSFNVGYCEDTYYSDGCETYSKNCCDCTSVIKSELLYGCVDVKGCYNSNFLNLCENCSDSEFLYDCRGCRNCYMCVNLRNKSFCIENVQYSQSEYLDEIKEKKKNLQQAQMDEFDLFVLNKSVRPYANCSNNENAFGDFIFNSKNIFSCFDAVDSQDLRYCFDALDLKDSMDTYQTMDKAELHYETHASSECYDAQFCNVSHRNKMIRYTDLCFDCENIFGCVGLKRHKYCIFNKQYTKEEYEVMVPRIIEKMKERGEYGEFFPIELSPFAYNETLACDYFPLGKDEVVGRGWGWRA